MKDPLKSTLRAACAGVALLLVALLPGCNDIGDDGDIAEAVPVVTAVAITGAGAADGLDTTVGLTVFLKDRTGGKAGSFFNEVIFTDYSVTFTLLSGGAAPANATGLINTGFTAVGSSVVLGLVVVLSGSEPAGSTVAADLHVTGHDVNGRPINLDHQVIIIFT
ncbi:MAG: hypothetical protein ACRD5D_05060 [Candidatus Polarisedimenticolia bacterium]